MHTQLLKVASMALQVLYQAIPRLKSKQSSSSLKYSTTNFLSTSIFQKVNLLCSLSDLPDFEFLCLIFSSLFFFFIEKNYVLYSNYMLV